MTNILCAIFLITTTLSVFAAEYVESKARVLSYTLRESEAQTQHTVSPDQKRIIRMLVERLNNPITPDLVIPANSIAEIIFSPEIVNRPKEFDITRFMTLWQQAEIEGAANSREISLAPDRGYLLLKDGKVINIELYGNNALLLYGFMFRMKKAEQAGAGYPPQGVGSPDP